MKSYKTLRGLLRQTPQMTIEQLFSGKMCHKTKRWITFHLSDDAKRDAAEIFAEYLLSTKGRRSELAEALMDGRGDLSLFQCFYIRYTPKYGIYCSNSLSGSAFNYCKRNYLKQI